MELTAKQKAVRDHRGGSLIVSAGAGSGKTMTLVSHVMSRLCDPASPGELTRLLIVTYTNAAAEEMRSRLKKELEDAIVSREEELRAAPGAKERAELERVTGTEE